jgi:hypothetical protein
MEKSLHSDGIDMEVGNAREQHYEIPMLPRDLRAGIENDDLQIKSKVFAFLTTHRPRAQTPTSYDSLRKCLLT